MAPMQMLFSFRGRIRRAQYWLWSIGAGVLFTVVAAIVLVVTGATASLAPGGGPGGGTGTAGWLIYGALAIGLIWVSLALEVKRWHDRDKNWYWLFTGFVPIVGECWLLFECGFLGGTPGPNRFGPAPGGITRSMRPLRTSNLIHTAWPSVLGATPTKAAGGVSADEVLGERA